MRVQFFQTMIRSNATAVRALRSRRWGAHRTSCPRCVIATAYPVRAAQWRCGRCRYTFGVLTGTWAAALRVQPTTLLWLIKLFELELTAAQAAVQTGVSYPTALKAFTVLRRAILAEAAPSLLRHEVEADERATSGRAARAGTGGRARDAGRRPRYQCSGSWSAGAKCR